MTQISARASHGFPTSNFILVVAYFISTLSHADPLFPDLPSRSFPAIQVLPSKGEIILEIRSTPLSGDPVTLTGKAVEGPAVDSGIEIGVFDLSKHAEEIWEMPASIGMHMDPRCTTCTMRSSWAAKSRQLLLFLHDGVYLIDAGGSYKTINFHMPGQVPYIDAFDFAATDDGRLIAFNVNSRDGSDKSPDVNDPVAAKWGKLYLDLMYEDVQGSNPKTIVKGESVYSQAWSPDGTQIAYRRNVKKESAASLEVANIEGRVIFDLAPVHTLTVQNQQFVQAIRWSPDGKSIGFIVWESTFDDSKASKHTLFVVNADGSNLHAVHFAPRDINVSTFAWSPSGKQIVFRSDFQAAKLCNRNLSFSVETGHRPCRDAEHVYTSNIDGSSLKQLTKDPEYRNGNLYWIQ
jgi:dipeptidyl aminopeptidase/acylaminoacyl peptidase